MLLRRLPRRLLRKRWLRLSFVDGSFKKEFAVCAPFLGAQMCSIFLHSCVITGRWARSRALPRVGYPRCRRDIEGGLPLGWGRALRPFITGGGHFVERLDL